MSEDQVLDMDKDYQKLVLRWLAMGHEVIHSRRLYRHKTYRKDFAPDTGIRRNGISFITNFGHTLKFSDVLPERADLCLDMDACVVDQQTFAARYKEYLRGFDFPEMTDLDAEFVPDVYDYIVATPDVFSDSRGFIEVGYDARKKPDEIPTHKYDPNKDEFVAIQETQHLTMEVLQAMLAKLESQPEKRGPGRPPKVVEQ